MLRLQRRSCIRELSASLRRQQIDGMQIVAPLTSREFAAMQEHTHSIRGETRWIRNEDGEYRVTVCIHPDDVATARRLFGRPGTPTKAIITTTNPDSESTCFPGLR